MSEPLKGQITNRAYSTKVRDYSGLLVGGGTPTDIDGFIEWKGEKALFIELKYGEIELTASGKPVAGKGHYGQMLAFERLCDAVHKGGMTCIFILCTHSAVPGQDIIAHECPVACYRFKGKWYLPQGFPTAGEAVRRFHDWDGNGFPLGIRCAQ